MPLPCPDCGFTFGWTGRWCGHCRGPRVPPDERRRQWERAVHLSDVVGSGMGIPPARLRAVAVACLRRALHLRPDLAPAVDDLERTADAVPDPTRPAPVPPFIPSSPDPADEVGNAVRVLADAGVSAGGVQAWTVQDVADRCARALAFHALPPRPLLDFPLPPELEPHRGDVAASMAGTAAAAGAGDWSAWGVPRLQSVVGADPDGVRAAHEHLARAATESFRRRQELVRAEEATHCAVARDVVGYPWGEARLDPDWRTGTVVALARGMVGTGDFSPMPILGDALMDAGCPSLDEVAVHCRADAPHVRGCWVLRLILDPPGGA